MAMAAAMDVDVAIIGAGISGIVTLKTLLELGLKAVVLEATDGLAGLWRYTKDGYGVTSFTHINVCKYNYSFSDYPFPPDVVDFPHHSDMYKYVCNYVERFDLARHIRFTTRVEKTVQNEDKTWTVSCSSAENTSTTLTCKTLVVASGHHAKPKYPSFKGQDTFTGVMMHSVAFKNAAVNELTGKRVVVVGIGNSAVDTAVHLADVNGYGNTFISTRSGAWVLPNYVVGYPIDLHANRLLHATNWRVNQLILEGYVYLVFGSPWKWNLNPKAGALQTQPTVSPTLIHNIQRGKIKVVGNIKEISGSRVVFEDGNIIDDVDALIFCTGYGIDLPYLPADIKRKIVDEESNSVALFENVFSPDIGKSLAFIGFVQPVSGGILNMSEVQAQWLGQIIIGACDLPAASDMKLAIAADEAESVARYYASTRHTIQRDPLVYNDRVASYFGAKPELWKHPGLAFRLLFGCGGSAQWRLQGPYRWPGAAALVRQVPVPPLNVLSQLARLLLLALVLVALLYGLCCALFEE